MRMTINSRILHVPQYLRTLGHGKRRFNFKLTLIRSGRCLWHNFTTICACHLQSVKTGATAGVLLYY